jgi:hypothetical protein
MSKLPNLVKLLVEDFKDVPGGWIERLLTPINLFFESMTSALNKNLTFSENIRCTIREITFTTSAAYVTPSTSAVVGSSSALFSTLKFATGLNTKAQGILLIYCKDTTNSVYMTIPDGVYVDWLEINGNIEINYIAGLTKSRTYTIKVMVI